MKKTYIAPEVEIKRFNTEDIMAGSSVEASISTTSVSNVDVAVADINYDELFAN